MQDGNHKAIKWNLYPSSLIWAFAEAPIDVAQKVLDVLRYKPATEVEVAMLKRADLELLLSSSRIVEVPRLFSILTPSIAITRVTRSGVIRKTSSSVSSMKMIRQFLPQEFIISTPYKNAKSVFVSGVLSDSIIFSFLSLYMVGIRYEYIIF